MASQFVKCRLLTQYLADLVAEYATELARLARVPLADIAPDDLKGYWLTRAKLADDIAGLSAEISRRKRMRPPR